MQKKLTADNVQSGLAESLSRVEFPVSHAELTLVPEGLTDFPIYGKIDVERYLSECEKLDVMPFTYIQFRFEEDLGQFVPKRLFGEYPIISFRGNCFLFSFSIVTTPFSCFFSPTIVSRRVDFPLPEQPINPRISPCFSVKEILLILKFG
jgi:hypothetical protein